jgi:hypothetical protein
MSIQFQIGEYVVCVEGKTWSSDGKPIVEKGKVYQVYDQYIDGTGDRFIRVRREDGSLTPNLYANRFQRQEGYIPMSPVIEKIRQMEARRKPQCAV